MLKVTRIENDFFQSNTYILSFLNSNNVWLIDLGDYEKVISILNEDSIICKVFITHAHYDHIYGLNRLTEKFPECEIYASEFCKAGLYSKKLNLSLYFDEPFVFKGKKVNIIHENDEVLLVSNEILEVIETPGHNSGCLCFKIGNFLFTGDSYIPNHKVVTTIIGGEKEKSNASLEKIFRLINKQTILCPGHGPVFEDHKPFIHVKI